MSTIITPTVEEVDHYGDIRAQSSRLDAESKLLKAKFLLSGLSQINGHQYRVTISSVEREDYDVAALVSELNKLKKNERYAEKFRIKTKFDSVRYYPTRVVVAAAPPVEHAEVTT